MIDEIQPRDRRKVSLLIDVCFDLFFKLFRFSFSEGFKERFLPNRIKKALFIVYRFEDAIDCYERKLK